MTTAFPRYPDKLLQQHEDDPDFLFTGEGLWFTDAETVRWFDADEWGDSELTLEEVESDIVNGSDDDAGFYWPELELAERRWVAAGNPPHSWKPSPIERRQCRLLAGPYPFAQYPAMPVLDENNDPYGRYTGEGWYYSDAFVLEEFDGEKWGKGTQVDQRMHLLVGMQDGINANYVAKQLDLIERAERIWIASGHSKPYRPIEQLRRWMKAEGERIQIAKAAGCYDEYGDDQIPLPTADTVWAFPAEPVEPLQTSRPLAPRPINYRPSEPKRHRGAVVATVIAAVVVGLIAFRVISTSSIGATAQCQDGTYSHSQNHSGTCSSHGGVAQWLNGNSGDSDDEQQYLNDQNQDGPAVGEP